MSMREVKQEKLLLYLQGEVQRTAESKDLQYVTILSVMYG